MLKNESDFVDTYLSFLLLFSILEHSLGDIYLSTNGSKQCPTNLKELLMTKEIQQLIGENVALMMYVLAGSPQGVNLRNVLWHGFASLNEIPPQYGFTLILLIPQLEHSLRKVFAWVNGCPDRVLTAESTTLYTTFDEILAPSLPDGSENQLRNKIGDKYLEMLLDVLVHPDGQRIRDHISHGEVHLDLISQGLCSHVICICIAFAVYFSDVSSSSSCINTDTTSSSIDEASDLYANSVICQANMESYSLLESATVNDDGIDLPLDDHSIIQQIIRIANNYHSVYHPIEILKNERFVLPPNKLKTGTVSVYQMTLKVIDSASQRYHQWMRKELRSRQRTNYKRLVNCLPFYQGVLKLTLVLVVVELASLHESTQPSYI
ncbi:hypothetical protein QZH41_009019, partial [Actinostola sp. cb2023]